MGEAAARQALTGGGAVRVDLELAVVVACVVLAFTAFWLLQDVFG